MILKATALAAALLLAAGSAAAQSSNRAGHGEVFIGPVFTDGKSYTFDGGTTVKTDTGFGINLGYAYNFNAHLGAGIEVAWSESDYRATVQGANTNLGASGNLNGTIETSTLRFLGNYHFSSSAFTPYLTGGFGWTYIDTNIPSGLPENVCWAYPWYGTYCATYVPTQTTTRFSYNVGAGLRLDSGRGLFRLLVNQQWFDFGGSYGSDSVTQVRIDFGTKF